MTAMTLAGDFPAAALGLIFSLGCALLLAFVVLRFVIGLVTREQYNVTDDYASRSRYCLDGSPWRSDKRRVPRKPRRNWRPVSPRSCRATQPFRSNCKTCHP